jgi:hypothetical protein
LIKGFKKELIDFLMNFLGSNTQETYRYPLVANGYQGKSYQANAANQGNNKESNLRIANFQRK